MKYCIRIIGTEKRFFLNATYNTHDEAMAAAKENQSGRNGFEIHPVYPDWVWCDKELGFLSDRERDRISSEAKGLGRAPE